MKYTGYDHYGDFLERGQVDPEGDELSFEMKDLPEDIGAIVGWQGIISTFGPTIVKAGLCGSISMPGLHAETWLSLKEPVPKEGELFGILSTGDAGHAISGQMFFPENYILVPPGVKKLAINTWAHNMGPRNDWHGRYVIFWVP